MKRRANIRRATAVMLLMCVMIAGAASCFRADGPDAAGLSFSSADGGADAAGDSLVALAGGESAFVIVRGEDADSAEVDAAVTLRDALEAITGTSVTLSDDFDGKADNSGRREILVGSTNRTQTQAALEGCGEYDFAIRLDDGKLVIAGKSPAVTAYAVKYFLKTYCGYRSESEYTAAPALYIDAELSVTLSYAGLTGQEYDYTEVTNMNCARPERDIIYSGGGEASYGKLDTVTVSKSDPYTGGPQFIAKLYTEGLSRAPEGAEYAAAAAKIAAEGCTAAVCGELASAVFGSAEFEALRLTPLGQCFAVYRAVLSRDPTKEEVEAFTVPASDASRRLTQTGEFAELLDSIIAGPYFWRGANEETYTGGEVILASELQKRLEEFTVTALPEGTLVIMDAQLTLPRGSTLTTEGAPTHYTRMARLLRTKDAGVGHNLVYFCEGATLSNIFIDGNMSAFALDDTAAGSNTVIASSYCNITYCRVSDSVSHQNVWSLEGTEQTYIAHNLITAYASNHDKTWQDGISCLSTGSVIEYNDIVDATDAPVAVFRYLENDESYAHVRAQNSIIRFNKLFNAGNSCYAAHDYETVNYGRFATGRPLYPANMTGLVSYENQIWTSWRAHCHMVVTFSTMPWQGDVCDRAFGGSFYNNYSPEGCFVVCACGVCVDKVTGAAIRGNSFTFYLGDWCRSDPRLGARMYSVNSVNSSGDFQPGYADMGMATESAVFIVNLPGGLQLETAESVTLRGCYMREGKVTIPLKRFLSE